MRAPGAAPGPWVERVLQTKRFGWNASLHQRKKWTFHRCLGLAGSGLPALERSMTRSSPWLILASGDLRAQSHAPSQVVAAPTLADGKDVLLTETSA